MKSFVKIILPIVVCLFVSCSTQVSSNRQVAVSVTTATTDLPRVLMLTSQSADLTFSEDQVDGDELSARYRTTETIGQGILLDGYFARKGSRTKFGPIRVNSRPQEIELEDGTRLTIASFLINANGAPAD